MDARTFGNYLSRMRKAQGLPDINTLEPLADALGLTLADLMHCRAPEEADAAPTIPLEDFFTMLRRQHTVDWHSVRTALLGLSIALALWGVLACPGNHCGALVWSWRWFFSGRRLDAFSRHFPVVRGH